VFFIPFHVVVSFILPHGSRIGMSTLEQQAIANLVEDFPRVWHDERTLDRDRKRMVRLLLEDVTLCLG
jgi:hypothetical protein